MPGNPANLNLDNIRVAKLVGGALHQSYVVHGMVSTRDTSGTNYSDCYVDVPTLVNISGTVKQKQNCKVLVLGCGLEMTSTEAKGTVLIENADQVP